MRYILLIYGHEADAAKMTEAEGAAIMQAYYTYTQALTTAGVIVSGEPLQSVTTATTVRVRNGKRATTDGPFAETKEQLGGFYVLNCKNLDEAIEWAAQCPGAKDGSMEVRPIMELPGM